MPLIVNSTLVFQDLRYQIIFFWFHTRYEEQRFFCVTKFVLVRLFLLRKDQHFTLQSFTKCKLATGWWWLSNCSGEILLPSYWRSSRR